MPMSYRISPSSMGAILRETMLALCMALEEECLSVPTTDSWKEISNNFERKWNFPNCCGAIDGKHIRIQASRLSGCMNYNYKNFFSIVLLAVVDADYRFLFVDIGASGSLSDGGIFSRSAIGNALETGALGLPNDKTVGGTSLPHVILGDDAFPLRKNLLKPYPGRGLVKERRVFNYRLSRARIVSENGFGILAARWRVLHTSIIGYPDLVKLIVKTCVLLHNFLMKKGDTNGITGDILHNEDLVEGSWRQDPQPTGLQIQGSNNYPMTAAGVRDAYMAYFNGEGAVPWQDKML